MSNNLKLKVISIMDAIRDNSGELWVVNVNKSKINKHSDLTRVQLAMKEERIMVEATWVPQNLAELGTRDLIIQSVQFKAAVNQGLLKIIDPVSAREEIEKNPGAKKEILRLQTDRNAVRKYAESNTKAQKSHDVAQDMAESDGDTLTVNGNRRKINNELAMQNDTLSADEYHPAVLSIMAQAETRDPLDLHAALKRLDESVLTAKDYQHVYDVAVEYGYDKLQRWAEKKIDAKLKEAGRYGQDQEAGPDYED